MSDHIKPNQRSRLWQQSERKGVYHEQFQGRNYKGEILDKKGSSLWIPPLAPQLSALNAKGNEISLTDYANRNVILIFYLGGECLHCMEQMREANQRWAGFQTRDTDIVAISKDNAETISGYETSGFNITFLTDKEFVNARRFESYDDFEDIELHSTILVDKQGRIHWSKHGGDPFMDFDFLESEVEQLNRAALEQAGQ